MNRDPSWADFASCPTCRNGSLTKVATGIACARCKATYPLLDGVPWLFREPALVLGEWQNRLRLYLEEFRLEERIVRGELAGGTVSPAGTARLSRLADAYAGQVRAVERILAPLALQPLPAPHAAMTGFGARVPRHQDLHSYYVNLHRDWAWGEEENALALEEVCAMVPAQAPGRTLVLGAGGCRLAYDLHQRGLFAHTVALDINPLLLLAARAVLSGGEVELYEFPIAPRTSADHAVLRHLSAPEPARAGLDLVFADALDAPFAPASFDIVITPWLVDIVDDEFAAFARRVNLLLRPGGVWINFGSVSFTGLRPSRRLGLDEVWERVADAGYSVLASHEREIPYMRSPASRHSRRELVLTYAARKERDAGPPPPPPALPAWLLDPRVPVPVTEQLEVTAVASRLQAFVLSLVNGERSAADLAAFLVEQKLLGAEAALAAVRGLLMRIYDGERRRPPDG